jgi:hypothetical protein
MAGCICTPGSNISSILNHFSIYQRFFRSYLLLSGGLSLRLAGCHIVDDKSFFGGCAIS